MQTLFQSLEPGRNRWEVEAVRAMLLLVPAGADADLQPAITDVVNGGQRLGQIGRVAIAVAEHQHPQTRQLGPRRERGQKRQRLRMVALGRHEMQEVIVEPD